MRLAGLCFHVYYMPHYDVEFRGREGGGGLSFFFWKSMVFYFFSYPKMYIFFHPSFLRFIILKEMAFMYTTCWYCMFCFIQKTTTLSVSAIGLHFLHHNQTSR